MVRMEHVAQIHPQVFLLRGMGPIDHVEEISCFPRGRVRMNQFLALTIAMEIGRSYPNPEQDQPNE